MLYWILGHMGVDGDNEVAKLVVVNSKTGAIHLCGCKSDTGVFKKGRDDDTGKDSLN